MKPRARRIALIVASVPLETKRTISTDGTASTTSSASSVSSSLGAPKLDPFCSACDRRFHHRGWQWPRIIGPQEPMKSR